MNWRKKTNEIKPVGITLNITAEDFRKAFGRWPDNQEEFEEFTQLCQVGVENQLDWEVIMNCARTYMRNNYGRKK